MKVRGVDPGGWGYCDQVVTEIYKCVDEMPVIKVVVFNCTTSLHKPVHLIPAHHVVTEESTWFGGCRAWPGMQRYT